MLAVGFFIGACEHHIRQRSSGPSSKAQRLILSARLDPCRPGYGRITYLNGEFGRGTGYALFNFLPFPLSGEQGDLTPESMLWYVPPCFNFTGKILTWGDLQLFSTACD